MFVYKVIPIKANEAAASVEKILNDMGSQGWEMCGTQTNGYGATIAIMFKKHQ